ncbi:DNA repair protein RecO [Thiohalomonas denitrificans]|uniref:DNA repair protein RecO n=1 Tax=Thiohalomonas denitrificans TaxID=415747 RepID=A0A1G5QC89_9GAMM|nr:DNA repair protein RecO [Thiohalomonas denitrificans]SCZ59495.1 DNA replication and repair protein RecO [Thiohalomonas denitrificans]
MNTERRISLEPGFVLHRKPYRDTSLLLEVFTGRYGRVGLVAKGARRPRSALKGLLQPFQPLLLSWTGRGELRTLTGAEPAERPLFPAGPALAGGFYLNEVLLRLVERHDPQPDLYPVYARTVSALTRGSDMEWTLRLFERDLLQCLGYGLLLGDEAEGGGPVQSGGRYWYHLERGPVPDQGGGGIPVRGETLLALASGLPPPDPQGRAEAKLLMRNALRLYLGDKPLASRALFRQFAGSKRPQPSGE